MQEITIELEIDRCQEFSGYEKELVRYVGKVGDTNRIVAHHVCDKGYSIPIGEIWYFKVLPEQKYVMLQAKKEHQLSELLLFKANIEYCEFSALKQHCLFYMQYKKSHAIFFKVSDTKALLLEGNHKNDGFIIDPETRVYPYYLQGLSHVQREGIAKVLNNYFMTE